MKFLTKVKSKYRRFKVGMSPQQNLFYGFLTYVLLGFGFLCLPFVQKNSVSILDHLFIATSAVSTTGLVTISISDTYTILGQAGILLLFQLGGIGYLTFTTFFILSTSKNLTHWHRKLLNTEFTLPTTLRITDFLKSVILFSLLMEVLGAVAFLIAFTSDGMSFKEAMWPAIFHSVSAFCTAGFSLFNSGFTDYVGNGPINLIISILAISGSLGFIVVTDILLKFRSKQHRLSFTTKIIFWGFLLLLLFGFTFFYFLETSISTLPYTERAYAAFFQSMSAMTTVGFNTVDFGSFLLPMLIITMILMYIGASPSGTAGGIKITTLTAVFAIMKSRIKGDEKVTFLGRIIPVQRLYVATSSFIFYSILILIGTFLLSLTENFAFEKIIFEVASALGTVGLSTGITGDLTDFGKSVIIVLMFIGRLGVLTFGIAIWSKTAKDTNTKALKEDLAV